MCAVGRCLIDPSLDDIEGNSASNIHDLENMLKPQYRGHGCEFWQDLQSWHDMRIYWNTDGLHELGQEYFDKLKEKYADKK